MPDVVALPQSLTATAREPSTVSVLAVDDVPDNLDVLEALGERADTPLQPFQVGGRGEVERAHRRVLRRHAKKEKKDRISPSS